jgi:hypothetical protein
MAHPSPLDASMEAQTHILYNHFLSLVEQETPDRLLERFQILFMDGRGYPDRAVTQALEELLTARISDQDFIYILNRCCHILVNRWQLGDRHSDRKSDRGDRPMQSVIPLVELFSQPPINKNGTHYRTRTLTRLHQVVASFRASEQYLSLSRLAQVVQQRQPATEPEKSQPLGSLICRYPYLYDHCLVTEDSDHEHQRQVLKLRGSHQQQFESHLSKYVTYQIRYQQLIRQGNQTPAQAQALLSPVSNPTFLSNQELSQSLRRYVGKVEGGRSYQDVARQFNQMSQHSRNFGTFKGELYEYLTHAVDADYGNRSFNRQLAQHLKQISPENHDNRLSDFLIVRTCSQVVNLLVIESPRRADHFLFIDLLNNLGSHGTISLLLKLVLFCRKVKPYLEKRFSILFTHYETNTQNQMWWFIHALEHLQLALTTNFGNIQLPAPFK